MVSESTTIRSVKVTVISSTLCLNSESWISSTSIASDSAAAGVGRRSRNSQKPLSTPQNRT